MDHGYVDLVSPESGHETDLMRAGMVTTWYIGPIAKKIGEYGGDVANELALVFTLIAYIPLRKLELKKFGR